jgi:UDP-glucose:(heptosyl)LPS alpha-1,3-glucosyltransferase
MLQQSPADAVIGFNKMPGLDVYYAADVCFAQKAFEERNFFYRLTPRCRQYLALEKSVFGVHSNTEILMISKTQIDVYQRYYNTPNERLHLLPPGIRRERILPADYETQRPQWRKQYGLRDSDLLMMFVGSDFRRKGLDRALHGIAALSPSLRERVQLWVAGQDNEKSFMNLVRTLNLEKNVRFLGARNDVAQLLWSADALIHPAYSENTGTVLLEAVVAGLPVIASSACGYAHYITENQLGWILEGPITPLEVADAISEVFSRTDWRTRCIAFATNADIYSMPDHAVNIIERVALRRSST